MAAQRRSSRRAGVFGRTESAHCPGLGAAVGLDKRQQVQRARDLASAVATQHEQQEPGRVGHRAVGAQRLPAQQVGQIVEDDLGHHPLACQPAEEFGQAGSADPGLVDFSQTHRYRLGTHRTHHRDLRRRGVDLGRLAGDLQHQRIADRHVNHAQGFAVACGVQAVAALRVADVQVQHRRTRIQTALGLGRQVTGRQRQRRMVGGLLVRTVGRDREDQRFGHRGSTAQAVPVGWSAATLTSGVVTGPLPLKRSSAR